MDYDEVATAMLAGAGGQTASPEVVQQGSPARRLRDACEPVAMHAVWSRRTNQSLAGLGLEFMGAYVAGRAASLGDPVGAVVASAFAWFEPQLIATVYETARQTVDRRKLTELRDTATAISLQEVLDADDVGGIADELAAAVEPADGTGRPLFCGLRAKGRPADPAQRLWWACDLVREHRGDSHVAASLAAGVGPVEMNILTELWLGMPLLSYTASRGWSTAAMSEAVARLEARQWLAGAQLTDAGRAARQDVEHHTDDQEASIVAALGERFEVVCSHLDRWSGQCIEAGFFPRDVLKRAAG